MPEATLSFEDGALLPVATDIRFRNGLGRVYDWEGTGVPTEVKLTFANPVSRCEVLNLKEPYAGTDSGDRAASTALVDSVIGGGVVVHEPYRSIWGLEAGMGEGGATYDVIQAIYREPDDRVTFVTARVFAALAVQHTMTVTCDDYHGLSLTISQVVQLSYADIRGTAEY